MDNLRLETIRRDAPPPAALAIAGDCIAVGDPTGRIELLHTARRAPGAAWPGIGPGQRVALAPSGRALLLRNAAGDTLELRTAAGDVTARLTTPQHGTPLATGTIVDTSCGELLIASTDRMRLLILDAHTGAEHLNTRVDRPRGFEYRTFAPTTDPDIVIAIGNYASEMKDSIVALSVHHLLTSPGYLSETLSRPALTDYAYIVAAGPGPTGEAVFYRDPEDDEDDDLDDIPDPHRLDAYGLHGYYARRLADRTFVGRPITAAAPTHDLLTATTRTIAALVPGGVQLLPRDGTPPTLLPAPLAALDPTTPQALLASTTTGDLRVLTIP